MSSLLDAIKNKRQAIAAKSGRERPTKLTSAKNLVRILPRWDADPEGLFYQDFGQHFIKDKAGVIQAVYICTATTFGKPCDVCSEIARHSTETTDEDMVKVLSEARSSSRILVNAIYLNGTHANAKTEPVLLELPVSVLDDIFGIMITYKEDHDLDLLDLTEGYDLVITKTGAGRDTKYNVTPSPKARAIPAESLGKCRDLEAYAKQEYEAGLLKAIAALGAVTGGPASAKALPALAAGTNAKALLNGTAPIDLDALAALDDDAADLEALVAVVEAEVAAPVVAAKPKTAAAKPKPAAPVEAAPVEAEAEAEADPEVDAAMAELDDLLKLVE